MIFAEGLLMMQEGARYKLFVPPSLGFGVVDQEKIPANSVLIYEIELVKIR